MYSLRAAVCSIESWLWSLCSINSDPRLWSQVQGHRTIAGILQMAFNSPRNMRAQVCVRFLWDQMNHDTKSCLTHAWRLEPSLLLLPWLRSLEHTGPCRHSSGLFLCWESFLFHATPPPLWMWVHKTDSSWLELRLEGSWNWHSPIFLARRWREEEQEFKVILAYGASMRPM